MNEYDIQEALKRIENELIASMIRNMDRHRAEETKEGFEWGMWQAEQLKALEEYKKRNKERYKDQFGEINSSIPALISESRKRGYLDQEAQILESIGKSASRGQGDIDGSFFQINDRKMNALIDATVSDMDNAETAMLRRANDQYRKTIFNAQVYANSGVGTYEKAVDMATKDFLAAGIQCIQYKNGSMHRIEEYAGMAIRTASKRAYLTGEGEKRKEWGCHLVIMNKRGNPCPKCLPFVGKILIDDVWSGGSSKDGSYPLMSSAMAAGLYHPNCKDSHTTYFPGISTPPDDKFSKKEIKQVENDYKDDQKQQYAKRQEEKFGRLANCSLDPMNKKVYAARQDQWEEQAYRPVTRGDATTIQIKPDKTITVREVNTYLGDVYISDEANIKPRALHLINKHTERAMEQWGISEDKKPKIVIPSSDEMPTAYGKYDAINNTVYYIPQVANSEVVTDSGSVEYHEMWHMKQAENFRMKYGEITKENYNNYIEYSCKMAKNEIDRLGINEYNVNEISDYAFRMYRQGRYDEVEAEYHTLKRK